MADASYGPKVYNKQGGDIQVIASGGLQSVESGGAINVESGGALKFNGTDKAAALAAAVATPVAGVAAGYKVARGVAAITGSGTVVTGLTTVVAVIATSADDLDGDALAGVSASIGNQAGAPAAGSVYLKAWKVTTGGAAGNPTLIAADAAKNINWLAIGT